MELLCGRSIPAVQELLDVEEGSGRYNNPASTQVDTSENHLAGRDLTPLALPSPGRPGPSRVPDFWGSAGHWESAYCNGEVKACRAEQFSLHAIDDVPFRAG